MTETSNNDKLEMLKGPVTYNCVIRSNGRFTVTVGVDNELHYGYGFSLDAAKENAAINALLACNLNKEKSEHMNAFYLLKEKRKGLIFQSIRKSKGIYDVSVQVDFVKYFGKGETQRKANNVCASNVLAAFESGDHERNTQALYKNAFNTLKGMYNSLLYKKLHSSDDIFEVYVNIDGIDYFGEGQDIQEATNDAAWEALESIWSGNHKKQLDKVDEYWYDDDDISLNITSENLNWCNCHCHICMCCN